MSSAFIKDPDSYVRHLDPIKDYIDQASVYLSNTKSISLEEAREFILKGIKNKTFKDIRDPVVRYFERNELGDRSETSGTLSQYIATIRSGKYIVSPSGTVYLNHNTCESKIGKYLKLKGKERSIAKKEGFVAEAKGDMVTYTIKNNLQTSKKLLSNAVSGAFCSDGNPLKNPSAHATLTSTTRSVSSFGNASNERVVSGNRHYWSMDIALNNLVSCSMVKDKDSIRKVIEKYNLYYPTPSDVVECVVYSSKLYWSREKDVKVIEEYANKMSEIDRAIFVYGGDLFHIRKHNPEFIRNYIKQLSKRVVAPVENAIEVIKKIDSEMVILAHQICCDDVAGLGKDYPLMAQKGVLETLTATAMNVEATVEAYRDFISAFFLTDNLPASIAFIQSMIRRSVVLSDTDSTCFATDEWIDWMQGGIKFNQESMGIGCSVGYMATQTLAHILATFSANINTNRDNLFTLAMKGEFVFKIFVTTSVAKHYYASQDIREGDVHSKPKIEIKGVHLKNSSSPPHLRKRAEEMMQHILSTLGRGEKLSMTNLLKSIADTEREITAGVHKGSTDYLRLSKIKDAGSYALDPTKSPYQNHVLWQEVFEPKYGVIPPPTYIVTKLPLTISNRTKTNNWLLGLKDKEFATRMNNYLSSRNKVAMGIFYPPKDYIDAYGIPEEIIPILDTESVCKDLTNSFRIIMESLGYYAKHDILISDLGY